MKKEIEAKFLNQDHEVIRKKLIKLGALCKHQNKLMRRTTMDFPDRRLLKDSSWVRLREELNGEIELTLKQEKDKQSIHGVVETVVSVGDYEQANQFLISIGLEVKAEQESKRELWELDGVEIMLDEWPWVPSFIEIEAPSEELVKDLATKLKLEWTEAKFGSVTPVYVEAFGISADQFEASEFSIKFGEEPPEGLTRYTK